jgi:2-C-methyl-D-erythritol 4-phosphate cytidylyltransferase
LDELTDEQKEIITGTSQVCTLNNYPIKMIEGDTINFKITTDADLELAEHIILKRKGEL